MMAMSRSGELRVSDCRDDGVSSGEPVESPAMANEDDMRGAEAGAGGREVEDEVGSDESDRISDGGGEAGSELCQVGDQSFVVPRDLYDLAGLGDVLNLKVWNECLSEEERVELAGFLPDMDQNTFARTMVELFDGKNFHFGSPLGTFFNQLKGGLCDPKVALHRHALRSLRRRRHYHFLRQYHNSMIEKLTFIRDVWQNCDGYGIDQRLQLLEEAKSRPELFSHWSNGNAQLEGDIGCSSSREQTSWRKSKPVATNLSDDKPSHQINGRKGRILFTAEKNLAGPSTSGLPSNHISQTKRGAAHDVKLGKKEHRRNRDWELSSDDYRDKDADQLATVSSYNPDNFDGSKKAKYSDEAWMHTRGGMQSKVTVHAGNQHIRHAKMSLQDDDMDILDSRKRWTEGAELGDGKFKYDELKMLPNRNVEHGKGSIVGSVKMKGKPAKYDKMGLKYYKEEANCAGSAEKVPDSSKRGKEVEDPRIYSTEVMPVRKGQNTDVNDVKVLPSSTGSYYGVDRKQKGLHSDAYAYGNSMLSGINGTQDGALRKEGKRPAAGSPYGIQVSDADFESGGATLLGCSSVTKNNKGKAGARNLYSPDESLISGLQQPPEDNSLSNKKMKRKRDARVDPAMLTPPDASVQGAVDMEPQKLRKKAYTLITPSIHTAFSFSIIHLLSAVRKAMVTPAEDTSVLIGGLVHNANNILRIGDSRQSQPNQRGFGSAGSHAADNNLPSLTLQEIVNRVRSNPGDPSILETQEPLQDLVRGVLKILGSKTTPLTVKNWKPMVSYERSSRTWLWVAPLGSTSTENDVVEETSPEAWGVSHYNLGKLVDAFAIWLKSSQDILKQIGSLPAPPASMLLSFAEKDRFKDLRAQKSLNTFNQSSDEVKEYFRREEYLRYSIPDRAFSYTAADGKKSIVAPLRRGGGKPTSKARDHFMLKHDRPPHVTILCLVRDAAARLPGSIGTRADVCTLLRDSQYIVEDVSDAQVNQVVSGALDRLHYERDPCVQFDADRKLWVYLHRDRVEEDFEDDGTSSTKKWKRPKKEANLSDGAGNEGDQLMDLHDHDQDLDADLLAGKEEERPELLYLRPEAGGFGSYAELLPTRGGHSSSTNWEALPMEHYGR